MISAENLSKKIGKFELKDINAEIPEGYICGLVGRNGAGKTSLIHLLLGLYKEDSGYIRVDGSDYAANEKEIRDKIGFVLNEDLLKPGLSLEANGKLYGTYYSRYSHESFLSYLKEFRLNSKKNFGSLSRGQKLKAQFAFSLAITPKYLIMDEPTANFDPEFKDIFLSKIRSFAASNGGVLISTQITDDLEKIADYLIYLDEGKLLFSGDIESFRDSFRIVHGDREKINHISKKNLLSIEAREYSCRALIRFEEGMEFAEGLAIERPSIEDFMYMYSRRDENEKFFN